ARLGGRRRAVVLSGAERVVERHGGDAHRRGMDRDQTRRAARAPVLHGRRVRRERALLRQLQRLPLGARRHEVPRRRRDARALFRALDQPRDALRRRRAHGARVVLFFVAASLLHAQEARPMARADLALRLGHGRRHLLFPEDRAVTGLPRAVRAFGLAAFVAFARAASAQGTGAQGTDAQPATLDEAQHAFDEAQTAFAASGTDCVIMCRALQSMARAAERICALTPPVDEAAKHRCDDARARVEEAKKKVLAACPGCTMVPSGGVPDEAATGTKKPTVTETTAA